MTGAIVTGAAALPDRLNRRSLFTASMAVLVPSGHALAKADPILPDALDREAVICRAPTTVRWPACPAKPGPERGGP